MSDADKIALRGPDGAVKLYDPKVVPQAIDAGAMAVSPEELTQVKLEKKYGGLGGAAAAFAAGVGRGATFGGTDWLASKLGGEETREDLRNLEQIQPEWSLGGEFSGAILPVALSGGTAAPEEAAALSARGAIRAAGVLPRATAALGGLAERGVAGLVGEEATSLAGRVAQKTLAQGARGAVEGSIYGLGSQFSEDALGDHELAGERYLAAAGHGALYGGVLGGLLGGGSELAETGFRTGAKKLAPAMEKLSGELGFRATEGRKIFVQQAEAMGGTRAVGETLMSEAGIAAGDNVEQVAIKARAAADRSGQRLGAIRSDADKAAYEGPKIADISQAVHDNVLSDLSKLPETNAGVIKSVNKLLSDLDSVAGIDSAALELPKPPKEPKFLQDLPPAEGIAPEAPRIDHVQAQIDQLKAVVESKPPTGVAVEEKQIAKLEKYKDELVGHEAEILKVRSNALSKADVRLNFEQAQEFRKKIDDIIRWNKPAPGAPPNAKMEAFKSFRNVFEKETENALDRSAAKGGQSGPTLQQLKDEKLKFRRLNLAANAAEDAVDRKGANNILSLRDTIIGSGGAVSAAHALMAGHPVLAAAGIASPFISKLVREHGTSTAAVLLKRASRIGILAKASNDVERIAQSSVSKFFGKATSKSIDVGVPASMQIASAAELQKKYEETVEQIGEIAASADTLLAHHDSIVGDLGDHAPKIADAAAIAAVRNIHYLQSIIPKGNLDSRGLMPHLHKQPPSQSQMASFMRSANAVHDPVSSVKAFAHDRLTKEAADALKNCYPSIHKEIVATTYAHLAEVKFPLKYGKQSQLSLLLGIPVGPMQDQTMIMAVQNTYNPGGRPEGSQTQSSAPSHPLNTVVSQTQTSIQRAASE